ncbi:LysM peptidoglycan-binding domain-containing protein [Streptomyces sp. RerS4]|uniref:LysM peptidoglycan-binding domain-containing protein n=1 Tax=Streptomyces sp. RerS4 TaxID=2942449 RepID=UPI00201C4D54|nr:LysM peptidoglycan-binding domain-containing protein [Streptomyces sp. RerS4]UQW99142.1 LysM peptidoglycan-binding domain-containing protein [Streptomyces sp. RerS4]
MPKPTPIRPPSRPQGGGGRTAAALVRAVLSLTVLAALLAGLPVLLWWATAIVGPPGWAALSSLLSTEDSGQVFLLALAVAGWVGWACFALAVLLEIPAQLRGRTAPQIRGLVGQRAAAALVGAVLVALPAGTALAAPAAPAPASPGISASPVPGTPDSGTVASLDRSAGASAAGAVTYTVLDARPAESLWSIAAQQLGDGERWTEIATLNAGRIMVDGTVFDARQPIQPGWRLTLPHDSGSERAGQAGAHGGQGGHVVRAGESLSTVAADRLGSADRAMEIFDLNRGQALPDGGTFTNPDLIHPGQHLTLPANAGSAPSATSPAAPTPDSPAAGTPTPAATPSSAPAPATTQPTAAPSPATPSTTATPPTAASPSASVPQQAPTPTTSGTPAAPSTERAREAVSVNWALVAGIGTLLAASLTTALAVRRILQQRRRRAGQTIAQDTDPTELEQVLVATGEVGGVELLDRLLRALAHQAATDQRDLPALRGALLSGKEVRLLLDEPADPIAPATTGGNSRTWILDPRAALPDDGVLREVQAPYPGLVTLGSHEDGLLLADLTTTRVLLLDGTPDEVLEVARALALELGTCAWTDYSEILTAGLGSRLAGLLPQGRIRAMPHLAAVATDLGSVLLEAHQAGEQALPWILVAAGDHDPDHLTQLADALAAARDLKTALVLPAGDAARRAFPHAELLDVTTGSPARLDSVDLPVTLQRITDDQYRQYVHALTVSTQDPQPATGPWGFAEPHEQPAGSGQPLTVRVTTATATANDPGNPFPALLAAAPTGTGTGPETVLPQQGQSPAETAETEEDPQEVVEQAVPSATPDTEQPVIRIDVLGPLRITGAADSAHRPRTAVIAALIHLRPGRTIDTLCNAMDPVTPWTTRTMHSRLSELRSVLGTTADGTTLLPRPTTTGYTFHPSVTSDWEQFKTLATRGLAAGAPTGIADLEAAMALVRGRPFAGRSLPWADAAVQEMLARITDTAHTLARWHAEGPEPDLDAARTVVQHALDIEETSEVLYRDLITIEATTGNQAAVRKAVARLQQMARTYDITLDDTTETVIDQALTTGPIHTTGALPRT